MEFTDTKLTPEETRRVYYWIISSMMEGNGFEVDEISFETLKKIAPPTKINEVVDAIPFCEDLEVAKEFLQYVL